MGIKGENLGRKFLQRVAHAEKWIGSISLPWFGPSLAWRDSTSRKNCDLGGRGDYWAIEGLCFGGRKAWLIDWNNFPPPPSPSMCLIPQGQGVRLHQDLASANGRSWVFLFRCTRRWAQRKANAFLSPSFGCKAQSFSFLPWILHYGAVLGNNKTFLHTDSDAEINIDLDLLLTWNTVKFVPSHYTNNVFFVKWLVSFLAFWIRPINPIWYDVMLLLAFTCVYI